MGAEIKPRPSARVLEAAERSNVLVYSVGSLYTSIVPIALLQGFAAKIRQMDAKILILNGAADRETTGISPLGHVRAVVRACLYSLGVDAGLLESYEWRQFVSDVIYPQGADLDASAFSAHGIRCVPCPLDAKNEYLLGPLEECLRAVTSAFSPRGPLPALP